MKTLLILGDSTTRQWLSKTLTRCRHEAVVADDMDAALAAFGTQPFPVAILSVGAATDGVAENVRRLRAVAPSSGCLLLAVGPEKHPAGLPDWFAAGVDDYLVACRDTPRLEERLTAAQRRPAAPVAEKTERTASVAAALSQARGELQTFYDQVSEGVLIADVETRRFVRVNSAACEMLGYSEAELLDMRIESIHPPEDVPKNLAAFAAGVQGRLSEVSDFRCLHKDGSIVDVDIVSTRLIYSGRPCLVGFFRDITERKRATEALRIQRDLGVVLSSTNDLATALDAVLGATRGISGVDCGGVYLVDEHGDLRLAACAGVSPEFAAAVRHFRAGSLEAQLVQAGQPIYEDYRGVTDGTHDARIAEGLRALAVLPVKHEGELIAVLNVASRTRDEIPVSTRHALESLASRLGGVIARLRTRAELVASRDNFQSLFDAVDDFLFILDDEARILHVNPLVERRLGYAAADLRGRSAVEVHPPGRREEAARVLAAMLADGGGLCLVPLMAKDGTLIPVETKVTRGLWNGKPALFGVARDVSERVRIAAALDTSERRYEQLVSMTTDAIMVIDADTRRFLHVNRACESLYGYTRQEFLALTQRDISAQPAESEASIAETLEGRLDRVPLRFHRKRDGTVFPVEISASTYVQDGRRVLCGIVRDITERLRAEETLRESEEKFLAFVERSPYGYVETDVQGNVESINQRVVDILGYTPQEGVGFHFSRFLDPAEVPRGLANLEALLRGVVAEPHEYAFRAKDGSVRILEMTSLPRRKNGRLVGFQSVALDVTRRRMAEQALREHDARLHTLLENLPDLVVTVDGQGVMQFVNRGAPHADHAELLGVSCFTFLAPESQAVARQRLAQAMATLQVQAAEVLDIYGTWWACRLVPLVENDAAQNVLIICTDVSEQKQSLAAVTKEQRLLRQLLDLHERDRQVMAYEIHDGLAQQLTAAMYGFQAFQRLREEMPEKAVGSFESGVKLLGGSIDEARRLIAGLRPPILDEFGIVAAIEYLIHDCHTRGGPQVEFDYDVSFERLAPPLESALFRIVQETLTNVQRHSQSAKARVGFTQAGDRIHIDVRDWGVGFDAARVEEGRFGLQGIRERVRLLGGRVVITTAPGQGTHIFVELPLIEAPPADAR